MGAVEECRLQQMHDTDQSEKFWWEARKITPEGEEIIAKSEYTVDDLVSRGPIEQEEGLRMHEELSLDANARIVNYLINNGWKIAESNDQGMATTMNRDDHWPEPVPIKLTAQIQDKIAVIAIEGEIDGNTISLWPDYLKLTLDNDLIAVIANLAGVRIMSDGGLKGFYFGCGVAKDLNVKLAVACPQPWLADLFLGMGIDKFIPLYESVEAALTSMKNIERVKMGASFGWIDKRNIIEKRRPWWKFWG